MKVLPKGVKRYKVVCVFIHEAGRGKMEAEGMGLGAQAPPCGETRPVWQRGGWAVGGWEARGAQALSPLGLPWLAGL